MSVSLNQDIFSFPAIKAISLAEQLSTQWQQLIQPFWQTMVSGELISADGSKLYYQYHKAVTANCAIVISAGRMEMSLKYAELSYELAQAGYSVFILDHRGQGLSERALSNRFKGDIANFSLYQQDFSQFMQQIVLPCQHQFHIALGHSMGCAILADYLRRQTESPFNAAILAAPMFGIYTSIVPNILAQTVALQLAKLNRWLSPTPWYAPGQGDYSNKPFKGNLLTSNLERYQWLQQRYQQQPDSQLGGVTTRWLEQAIYAMRRIQQQAVYWQTPVLLLQAANDKVVDNQAQLNWYQALPPSLYRNKVLIKQARHEVFMESDQIRQQAFNAINDFLQQLPLK